MSATYLPRIADSVVSERLRSAGAVLIEGPRACGKTSTAMQQAKSAVYLATDDEARRSIELDPGLVLNGQTPQLVDEWQLDATRVWNYIRAEVDSRQADGQFILTGSAVPDDDARRHTGAGRIARALMRPMSLFESGESTGALSLAAILSGAKPTSPKSSLTVQDIASLVVRGGWPTNLRRTIAAAAHSNTEYLATAAEEDLDRLGSPRSSETVQRLFRALARNIAMEQKIARIASEVDGDQGAVARSTVYAYLDGLRRLMIVEEQPPWSTHLRSRATLRKAPRTHFVDPSLACAALGASPERLLGDLNYFGLLFESLVVRDLRIYAQPLDGTVYHYRDSDDLEVDAVVQRMQGPWAAFEVKLGIADVDAAASKLLKFAEKVDTSKVGESAALGVITATGYGYTRPDGVMVIPIGALGP